MKTHSRVKQNSTSLQFEAGGFLLHHGLAFPEVCVPKDSAPDAERWVHEEGIWGRFAEDEPHEDCVLQAR